MNDPVVSAAPQNAQPYTRTVRWGAVTLLFLGSAVIAGWAFKIELAETVLPGFISMKANTAVGFICAGASLILLASTRIGRMKSWLSALLSVLVLLIGLFTLAEYVFHSDFGIDQLLFNDAVQKPYPGRLAPVTAVNFCFVGLALLLYSTSRKIAWLPQLLGLLTGFSALLAITGYLYGVPVLYGSFDYTSMALHTGGAFLLVASCLLCYRPQQGLLAAISSVTPGGWLSRRLLPAVILIPVILVAGLLGISGLVQNARLLAALIVVSQIVLFVILVWVLAFFMNRAYGLLARSEKEHEHTSRALSKSEEMLRQMQKLDVVGRLAGGVAHDYNNLLGIILGYSDLMLGGQQLDPKSRQKLEQIQQAGQSAAALTRQLLAFSRQQIIQPAILGLNDLVLQMAGMLRRLVREDIKLSTVPEARYGIIKADLAQIQQVLINLVLNAADAMPNGGQLTIRTEDALVDDDIAGTFRVSAGKFVRIVVTDTGVGISDEVRAHMFEPFFTTKPVGKGTGLGLATVYGAVQQNGGFIDVESIVGAGSSFIVYFPVTEAHVTPKAAVPSSIHTTRGETVLVAEDSPTLAALIAEVLTDNGYNVIMRKDGQEALEACRLHPSPIHALISDVIMPNMNGRELVDCVKRLRPETRIIFMSGYNTEVVVQQDILRANADFMEKPFTPSELLKKLREVLDRTQSVVQSA